MSRVLMLLLGGCLLMAHSAPAQEKDKDKSPAVDASKTAKPEKKETKTEKKEAKTDAPATAKSPPLDSSSLDSLNAPAGVLLVIVDELRALALRPNSVRMTFEEYNAQRERIKTLESGKDKREQASRLLDRVASGKFRQTLENEARELTDIGNSFRIRHSETSQEPLTSSAQVDYLFHRLLSVLRFVLSSTGRAS